MGAHAIQWNACNFAALAFLILHTKLEVIWIFFACKHTRNMYVYSVLIGWEGDYTWMCECVCALNVALGKSNYAAMDFVPFVIKLNFPQVHWYYIVKKCYWIAPINMITIINDFSLAWFVFSFFRCVSQRSNTNTFGDRNIRTKFRP